MKYINTFKNSLKNYNNSVNFNNDGTITIYDTNYQITLIYVYQNEGGEIKETYYKKTSITDNGNGIYEINFEVDYWLTYMSIFLMNSRDKQTNFTRSSFFTWGQNGNVTIEDPMLKNLIKGKRIEYIKTSIPTDLTARYTMNFSGMNTYDALGDSYTFCNFCTYYVFKQNGTIIALPVLSTNEVNIPYSYQTGNRPTKTEFRGISLKLNLNISNGLGNTSYYYYNFENVLKGLASTQGDNFIGKFFLPNLMYFNIRYVRAFNFTTSFQYTNNDTITYSGNNTFTTIDSQRIRFFGVVLNNKVYNSSGQMLDPRARVYLPTLKVNVTPAYTYLGSWNETINKEILRYYKFYLMNNEIQGIYCYDESISGYTPELYLYSFVFNQGGYCKVDTNNVNYDQGYLGMVNTIEERTLFFGYQLPSETNAYLSWYNANKAQMETTKVTQGLGFAMSSLFSVLGLVLSGTGIGAPIGLSMVAGGAMGAFSSISSIAKTNATIADTQRQLQTNFAQSNISDFNFLSLWFWYSNTTNWITSQYNIWTIERPDDDTIKLMKEVIYYFGYSQPCRTIIEMSESAFTNFSYWQWANDETLKPKIISFLTSKSNNQMVVNSDILPEVANWIYEKCVNGIRLWLINPNDNTPS